MEEPNRLQMICLNPTEGYYPSESNEISQAWYLEYGEFSALQTGDITGQAETGMAERLRELQAADPSADGRKLTVLKVAHHGSSSSTPASLLNQVRPVYAVISCGKDNSYGHPHTETLERLADAGVHVIRTDESGAVTVKVRGKKVTAELFDR